MCSRCMLMSCSKEVRFLKILPVEQTFAITDPIDTTPLYSWSLQLYGSEHYSSIYSNQITRLERNRSEMRTKFLIKAKKQFDKNAIISRRYGFKNTEYSFD